jgi:hypothetical protein
MKLVFYRIAKERKFLRGKVVCASKNHSQKASSKVHFQPVRSSFLHYELVFYKIAEDRDFVRRKVVLASENHFSKLHQRPMFGMYEVRSCII